MPEFKAGQIWMYNFKNGHRAYYKIIKVNKNLHELYDFFILFKRNLEDNWSGRDDYSKEPYPITYKNFFDEIHPPTLIYEPIEEIDNDLLFEF